MHGLFGRYNMYKRFTPNTGDWFRAAPTGTYWDWMNNGAAIDDVYELSPRTILNVRYAFYRLTIYQYPQSVGFNPSTLGFPQSYTSQLDPTLNAFPYFSISGYQGTLNNWWRYPHQSHSVEGNVTAIRGAHAVNIWGRQQTVPYLPVPTAQCVYRLVYLRHHLDSRPC